MPPLAERMEESTFFKQRENTAKPKHDFTNILGFVRLSDLVNTEGLLKRLKNIESKTDQQLDAIEDQRERQLEAISSYDATNKS